MVHGYLMYQFMLLFFSEDSGEKKEPGGPLNPPPPKKKEVSTAQMLACKGRNPKSSIRGTGRSVGCKAMYYYDLLKA